MVRDSRDVLLGIPLDDFVRSPRTLEGGVEEVPDALTESLDRSTTREIS